MPCPFLSQSFVGGFLDSSASFPNQNWHRGELAGNCQLAKAKWSDFPVSDLGAPSSAAVLGHGPGEASFLPQPWDPQAQKAQNHRPCRLWFPVWVVGLLGAPAWQLCYSCRSRPCWCHFQPLRHFSTALCWKCVQTGGCSGEFCTFLPGAWEEGHVTLSQVSTSWLCWKCAWHEGHFLYRGALPDDSLLQQSQLKTSWG